MHHGLWLLTWLTLAQSPPVATTGRLDHPAIREASGLVASRRHPGLFWTHNDSGNPSTLFAVTAEGRLVGEFAVGVANVDWEAIAVDDAGFLYIADIGNNDRRLPIRVVHKVAEPDPTRPLPTPLPVVASSYYRFPAGGRFDAEGLVVDGSRALLVSKRLDGGEAELFAVPIDPPASLFRPALPVKVGVLPGFREPATGADLSPDGRRLAVAAPGGVRVFARGTEGWKPIGAARFAVSDVEGVAWDGPDLVLIGEGRGVVRVAEAVWKAGAGHGR